MVLLLRFKLRAVRNVSKDSITFYKGRKSRRRGGTKT